MNSENKYSGSVPDTYNEYLVPLIFDVYAADLAKRVTIKGEAAVLETAAGTGVLTEYLARVLPQSSQIIASDINPAMMGIAERNLAGQSNIVFQAASGTELPFDDCSFDSVLCQFGIMFFPDIDLGYREAHRVLKQGGELIFNVWDSLDKNHFSRAVHEAAISLDSDNPPDFLKLPYAYNDIDLIKSQLLVAGFSDVSVEVINEKSQASSVRDIAVALAAGSPLAMQLAERGLSETAVDDIEDLLHKEFGDGKVSAPMQAIVFHARSST